MKIAILAHLRYPIRQPYEGGLEMHTHMLADELTDRGHDVTLIAKGGSHCKAKIISVLPKAFTWQTYKHRALQELQQLRMHFAERHAIAAVKTGNFDCVINNSLSALPYTHLPHIPMLTMLHTPLDLPAIRKVLQSKWLASPFHAYASVSKANTRTWRSYLPAISVIPNGIRLQDWHSDNVQPVKGRTVWSARITPEKGLHVAIAAVKKLGLSLDFVGPISDRAYFHKKIVPHLDENIRYKGHLNHAELSRFLASGEVFVASSLCEESFGLSVVEALASGTPVAVLPGGAMPEVVSPDVGALASDSNPDALSQAILQARTRRRETCRSYARRFHIGAMVNEYEQTLHQLLTNTLPGRNFSPAFGKLQRS